MNEDLPYVSEQTTKEVAPMEHTSEMTPPQKPASAFQTDSSTSSLKGKERAVEATPIPAPAPAPAAKKNEEDAKKAKEQAESEAFARKFNAAQPKGPLSVEDPEYQALVAPFRKIQAEKAKQLKEKMGDDSGDKKAKGKKKKTNVMMNIFSKMGN